MNFVSVATAADVAEGAVLRVEVGQNAFAVVNLGNGEFCALVDICPHAGARLSLGQVDLAERMIECRWHRAVFDLRTGEPKSGPTTNRARLRPVRVVGDMLLIGVEDTE